MDLHELVEIIHLPVDQPRQQPGMAHQVARDRRRCVVFMVAFLLHPFERQVHPPARLGDAGECLQGGASTASCPSRSPGLPRVRLIGVLMPAKRGTLTAAVRSGMLERVRVLKPAASILRCTSPTDQLHSGQAGTSRTISTASCCKPLMMLAWSLRAAHPVSGCSP